MTLERGVTSEASTSSTDRMGASGNVNTFEELRRYLFAVAYRMVGSVADAEDIVQEAYIRWERTSHDEVESPKSYLSATVTRLCIDHLTSARRRRETYVGPWLPEPLLTDEQPDVAEAAEQAESLSMAFLVVLETLSPVERAVFLLREVFGYDYDEIARFVDKSAANCRQISHRAREHVAGRRPRFTADRRQHLEVTQKFLGACASGDTDDLVRLLSEDAILWSDGGGKVRAARRPIEGREKVARFLAGILKKMPSRATVEVREVNARPAIVLSVDGTVDTVVNLDVEGELIRAVHIVVNPDKLRALMR